MELKGALAGQFRSGLTMVRDCIEACPEDLWSSGNHPRTFWRITYHALFYTHLYLMPNEGAFRAWEKHTWHGPILWEDDREGVPPVETTYSREELIDYVDMMLKNVDGWVEALDLTQPTSGFSWYSIPKMDHIILNVRHLGIHIGQLQELLYARGIDTPWRN